MRGLLCRVSDAVRRPSWGVDHGPSAKTCPRDIRGGEGANIVARNYRLQSGTGEIDLAQWHGATLVLVAVKTRNTAEYGCRNNPSTRESSFG